MYLHSDFGSTQKGTIEELTIAFQYSIQIAPVVVQRLDSESSTPLRRDQMPRRCAQGRRGFPVAAAKGIADQS
jgi:hypothetical protein